MYMKTPGEILAQLKLHFDGQRILLFVKSCIQKAGLKVTYAALLLYHAYHEKDTPVWARRIILGAIAYFIAPIDLVPDLSPFLGYYDDFGVMMFGLVSILGHVNADVRTKAREQMSKWFGDIDQRELDAVENQLKV